MMVALLLVACVAAAGWGYAGWLWSQRRQHVCPIAPPDRAVLLNHAGLPESVRALKGAPPVTYSRPRGKDPAIIYDRIGTAAVYKATSAKA